MQNNLKDNLLNIYLWFQGIAIVINFFLILVSFIVSLITYGLGGDIIKTVQDKIQIISLCVLIITIAIIYFINTIFAFQSTYQLKKGKNITNFQKVLQITFIIITVPLYLLIGFWLISNVINVF